MLSWGCRRQIRANQVHIVRLNASVVVLSAEKINCPGRSPLPLAVTSISGRKAQTSDRNVRIPCSISCRQFSRLEEPWPRFWRELTRLRCGTKVLPPTRRLVDQKDNDCLTRQQFRGKETVGNGPQEDLFRHDDQSELSREQFAPPLAAIQNARCARVRLPTRGALRLCFAAKHGRSPKPANGGVLPRSRPRESLRRGGRRSATQRRRQRQARTRTLSTPEAARAANYGPGVSRRAARRSAHRWRSAATEC